MAEGQQPVYVFRGVFVPILVKHPGAAGQAHGRQAVILGNHHIPGLHPVHQGKVRAVRPLGYGDGLRARAFHPVGLVAYQGNGDAGPAGFLQALGHHGTGIRVHEQAHGSSFSYRE